MSITTNKIRKYFLPPEEAVSPLTAKSAEEKKKLLEETRNRIKQNFRNFDTDLYKPKDWEKNSRIRLKISYEEHLYNLKFNSEDFLEIRDQKNNIPVLLGLEKGFLFFSNLTSIMLPEGAFKMMMKCFFLFLCSFLAVTVQAQTDLLPGKLKIFPVKGNIYIIQGAGGNIAVSVGSDGIVMVDTGTSSFPEKLEVELKKLHPSKPKMLFNTHVHGDHTGGNLHFGENAVILAHENVRKRLGLNPRLKKGLPQVVYTKEIAIHFNDEKIEVIPLPGGHTDGDSIIYFSQSGVLHMGDLFINGFFPYIDIRMGGRVQSLIKNMEMVLNRFPAETTIIPGHGPIGNMDDIKSYYHMLVETTRIVQQRIKQGKKFRQIIQDGLPPAFDSWNQPLLSTSTWLRILYFSLQD